MNHLHLKEVPKLSDCISFLYIEMAVIEQDEFGLVILKGNNAYHVPIVNFACILFGPGTSVTHAAMKTIANSGTFAVWCKRNMEGIYVAGRGRTSTNKNLIMQAKCYTDNKTHTQIARNMYAIRYPDKKMSTLSIREMRGFEGQAVREAYEKYAKELGIDWDGRNYRKDFESQTAVNQALSIANNILYDLCHVCLLSLGFSPDLGFIHVGNAESFVFDIADLYKEQVSIPCAFECAANSTGDINSDVRKCIHKYLNEIQFMKRFPKDMKAVFENTGCDVYVPNEFCLWTPEGYIKAGVNYENESKEEDNK